MKRIGASQLRKMNATDLKNLTEPLEVCCGLEPVRVLFPYEQFIAVHDAYWKLVRETQPEPQEGK